MNVDYISLLQALINCKSITPEDDGAIPLLAKTLETMGFHCTIIEFSDDPKTAPVKNLYAKLGSSLPNLCFAGHTDVVPVGNYSDWKHDPFAAVLDNDCIYGRGAVDMKGAIAAFISAVAAIQNTFSIADYGSISLLITGDEEGIALCGTKKAIKWLEEKGENITACIIGEPTSLNKVGDLIKIGARGSATFDLKVIGKQGHVAYHKIADNPISTLIKILSELSFHEFDAGTNDFEPTNLEIINLFVGNNAENVIPAEAQARFNIRFNNLYTAEKLYHIITNICKKHTTNFILDYHSSGEAFLANHSIISSIISDIAYEINGARPSINTVGGTSDARFIKNICPVLEFGLLNQTAHKVNEHTSINDLEILAEIYRKFILQFLQIT